MFNGLVISLIACCSKNDVIGKEGRLPWYYPHDLMRFKQITRSFPIIMGRKTFESFGRALPERLNIVITHNTDKISTDSVIYVNSLKDAYNVCLNNRFSKCFVIGGESIFKEAIFEADEIILTRILKKIKGDTYFPKIPRNFKIDDIEFDKTENFNAVFLRYLKTKQTFFEYLKNRLKYKILSRVFSKNW